MKQILAILKKELESSYYSVIAYFVIGAFTAIAGYFLFCGSRFQRNDDGSAVQDAAKTNECKSHAGQAFLRHSCNNFFVFSAYHHHLHSAIPGVFAHAR